MRLTTDAGESVHSVEWLNDGVCVPGIGQFNCNKDRGTVQVECAESITDIAYVIATVLFGFWMCYDGARGS